MEFCMDFLNRLDHDVSMKILMCLEDPSDLVRVSSVSRSWRHFVIANGLCKQLCLRMFPQLHRVDCVIEPSYVMKKALEVGCCKFAEWEYLKREHKAYAFLAKGSISFPFIECVADAISASSTIIIQGKASVIPCYQETVLGDLHTGRVKDEVILQCLVTCI